MLPARLAMKRIQAFELEDFPWFPHWLRACLTRLMVVMHKLLGTPDDISTLIAKALKHTRTPTIVDLCSGGGGPMLEVFDILQRQPETAGLTLVLTDLYPSREAAELVNRRRNPRLTYRLAPVNATSVDASLAGVRTLVGSFHHMNPATARRILQDAKDSRQPLCIYEMSDNNLPIALWWISIPVIFIMVFFITPLARPLTWKQLVFTYLLPVIPLCFAWDGAISNARTYTLPDLKELLDGLESEHYTWETGRIDGLAKKLYLLGLPC
jgi:hypothetical protein